MKRRIVISCLLISMLTSTQSVFSQVNFFTSESGQRVSRSLYYEASETPQYRYDYNYDKKGLLVSKTKKHFINNTWMPIETLKYEYDNKTGIVICTKVPSAFVDGVIDLDKMREIKKQKKDVDTFLIKNGEIQYLASFRLHENGNYRYQYTYKYDNDKLISITRYRYSYQMEFENNMQVEKCYFDQNSKLSLNFTYLNNQVSEVIHTHQQLTQKWKFIYNSEGLEKVEVYDVKDGVESYVYNHEITVESRKIVQDVSLSEKRKYNYDNNGNLIMYYRFSDSGGIRYNYEYESGNGNAETFIVKEFLTDFLIPDIE